MLNSKLYSKFYPVLLGTAFFLLFCVATAINSLLPDYLYRGIEKMGAITLRTVLIKLLEKLKTKSAAEMLALMGSMQNYVATNMDWTVIMQIANTVINNGISNVETMRLPVVGTYVEERRNDDARIYDTDWAANSMALYNFIYG